MMDRNEAVQKLSKVARISVAYAEDLYDSFFEKPVVPQYVADWYEEHKEDYDYELWDYFTSFNDQEDDDFKEWIRKEGTQPIITLVNMHQFGYEVEKEARYTVRIIGIDHTTSFLNYNTQSTDWYVGTLGQTRYYRTHHTRKELESNGFGWVFDCEGVEVKEVE